MTACSKWQNELLEVGMGRLISETLERHLDVCPDCTAKLAQLKLAGAHLNDALEVLKPPAGPSLGFQVRLARAIQADRAVRSRLRVWQFRAAALLAAAVVVAAFVWQARAHRDSEMLAAAAAIAQWRSPTDSLLRVPGDEFLSGGPKLGETYFSLSTKNAAGEKGSTKQRRQK